jgi:hypothetical protein
MTGTEPDGIFWGRWECFISEWRTDSSVTWIKPIGQYHISLSRFYLEEKQLYKIINTTKRQAEEQVQWKNVETALGEGPKVLHYHHISFVCWQFFATKVIKWTNSYLPHLPKQQWNLFFPCYSLTYHWVK